MINYLSNNIHPRIGDHWSQKDKKRMSILMKSKYSNGKHPSIGTKYNLSLEQREKISKRVSKKVEQFDKQGNYIKTWDSITEASQGNNSMRKKISFVCKGTRKTTGGFIWKYEENKK